MGYTKLDLAAGYTQVGVQLQNVGADGVIGLNDITFTGLTGYDWDNFAEGDRVIIWDTSTQAYSTQYLWADSDPYEMLGGGNKWMDGDYAPAAETLTVGSTLFIKSANGGAVLTAGEVASADSIEIPLFKGYTQIANPYPKAVALNDIAITGLVGYDWDAFAEGDRVIIWDPTTQAYSTQYLWADSDPYEMLGGGNKWMTGDYAPAEEVVPVGGSIFIKSTNGGTATFTK